VDWRKGFMKELKAKREREEEERVRSMMPKEREVRRTKCSTKTFFSSLTSGLLAW
jgi:hypothetical protein